MIIKIPGAVVGKARPRVTMHGTFMPKKYKKYVQMVAQVTKLAMRGAPPLDEPIYLEVDIYKQRPKSRPQGYPKELWTDIANPCHTKPDIDNAVGAIMDGMEAGGAFTTDSRVWNLKVRTWYAPKGSSPYAKVVMQGCWEH
tara:strand:- start:3863 stop:4285 length:423 start_codon:yes stop_codon:yes gene_type:complete